MSEEKTAVYEIDPGKRYILVFEDTLSMDFVKKLQDELVDFVRGDAQFLILDGIVGDIKLIKVEVGYE